MGIADSELGWAASTILHRYCEAIDHHDASALEQVFAEDVVLLVGGETTEGDGSAPMTFEGRATVVPLLASLFEQRDWARHLVSNVLVEVAADGEVAVRCSFQYLLSKPATRVLGVGDYRVTMRDVDGGLLITSFSASILDEAEVPRSDQPS